MVAISFEKITLSNGLDVILHEDHSLPIAAVNVWYHVGSKDEEVGRTGFAHLFEHVMFEGSKNHNKSFFEPLQKVGANLNGSTTNDRTNYWENVPSNYLELALWLESDRMGFLLDALDQGRFDIQRDVVKNERRQSYENRPYGMSHLALQPAVFPAPHPYNWPTIGSQEDLDSANIEDIKDFFRKYYAPSNASLAIVGDFKTEKVKALVEQYFGDLPPGPPINRVGRMDSDLAGIVSLTMRDKVQLPRLYTVWPTPPAFDSMEAPLDMLSVVLGEGKSSRLYRSLVYEKQIARDVSVYHHGQEIAGEFFIQATANPGHELGEIEEVISQELERILQEPPTDNELARAKNRIESHHIRQLERFGGFGGRADLLNFYNTNQGDPGLINTDFERYLAVTPEDIQKAANLAFRENQVKLVVLPEKELAASANSVDRSNMPGSEATPSFTPPVPLRTSLSNGLNIVTLNRPGIPLVSLGLLMRAGAITDPTDKPGLADLTASLLPEGTPTRSSQQISEEMEFLGAQLSSGANREYNTLSTETLTANWEQALDILADVTRNATFPQKEFDRLQSQHLVDLGRISDNPVTIASRASRAILFGPETSYGHPLSGNEKSIQDMTRDDVVAHFNANYGPGNATLMVVGDLTQDEVIAKAEAKFGDWTGNGASKANAPDSDGASPVETTIYLADKPGAAQSVIRAAHLTIPRHHADYFPLNMVNYIFGGQFSARLNMNLRQEKGYSYGYMSSVDWLTDTSVLSAGGSVQTEVTKEAVVETLKEFKDIRESRPVTGEEFQDARDGTLRSLPSQFETNGQILQQLMRIVSFDLPLDYFTTYSSNIEALTLDEAHRVATELIDDSHLRILVVGDAEVVEPGLRELGHPVVKIDYEGQTIG